MEIQHENIRELENKLNKSLFTSSKFRDVPLEDDALLFFLKLLTIKCKENENWGFIINTHFDRSLIEHILKMKAIGVINEDECIFELYLNNINIL